MGSPIWPRSRSTPCMETHLNEALIEGRRLLPHRWARQAGADAEAGLHDSSLDLSRIARPAAAFIRSLKNLRRWACSSSLLVGRRPMLTLFGHGSVPVSTLAIFRRKIDETAPCGRGSESALPIFSHSQSRGRRERLEPFILRRKVAVLVSNAKSASGLYSRVASYSRRERISGQVATWKHPPNCIGGRIPQFLRHPSLPSERNSASTSAKVKRGSRLRASEKAPSSMSSASIDSAVSIASFELRRLP